MNTTKGSKGNTSINKTKSTNKTKSSKSSKSTNKTKSTKSSKSTKSTKKLNTQMIIENIIYYDKLWKLNKKQALNPRNKDINIIVDIKSKSKSTKQLEKKTGGYDNNNIIITSTNIVRRPIPRPNVHQQTSNLNLINHIANHYGINDNYRHHFQTNDRIAYVGIQRNDSIVIRMQDPVNLIDRGHLNIGVNYYPHFTFRRNDGSNVRIYFRYNATDWNTVSANITTLLADALYNVASANATIQQSNYAIRDMFEAEYIAGIIQLTRNMLSDPTNPLDIRNMQNVGFNHGIGYNPLIGGNQKNTEEVNAI